MPQRTKAESAQKYALWAFVANIYMRFFFSPEGFSIEKQSGIPREPALLLVETSHTLHNSTIDVNMAFATNPMVLCHL